jgi:hypothetical protein
MSDLADSLANRDEKSRVNSHSTESIDHGLKQPSESNSRDSIGKDRSSHFYIAYADLAASPVTFHFNCVPVTFTLTSQRSCTVSIPPAFKMKDSESLADMHDEYMISAQVNLGTSFILTYRGSECEVRLGRRITISDSGTYIQQQHAPRH